MPLFADSGPLCVSLEFRKFSSENSFCDGWALNNTKEEQAAATERKLFPCSPPSFALIGLMQVQCRATRKCLARRERNSIALIFHSRKLPLIATGSFSAREARERDKEKVEETRLAVIPLRFIWHRIAFDVPSRSLHLNLSRSHIDRDTLSSRVKHKSTGCSFNKKILPSFDS